MSWVVPSALHTQSHPSFRLWNESFQMGWQRKSSGFHEPCFWASPCSTWCRMSSWLVNPTGDDRPTDAWLYTTMEALHSHAFVWRRWRMRLLESVQCHCRWASNIATWDGFASPCLAPTPCRHPTNQTSLFVSIESRCRHSQPVPTWIESRQCIQSSNCSFECRHVAKLWMSELLWIELPSSLLKTTCATVGWLFRHSWWIRALVFESVEQWFLFHWSPDCWISAWLLQTLHQTRPTGDGTWPIDYVLNVGLLSDLHNRCCPTWSSNFESQSRHAFSVRW